MSATDKSTGDIMLDGVLKMPLEHLKDPVALYQFYQRAQQAIEMIAQLREENTELTQQATQTEVANMELNEQVIELKKALQDFVDRVDRGEIKSKRTYLTFKVLLASPSVTKALGDAHGKHHQAASV